MQIPLIINSDNVLTLLKPYGRDLNLKINDIVRAEVLNVLSSGDVSLRIHQKNGESSIIVAKSDVPLTKGMTIQVKVTASDQEIKLQFMGTASDGNRTAGSISEGLHQKVLRMLSEFAGSRLKQEDFSLMSEIFRAIPDKLKASFPQFLALEKAMPEIEKLSSEVLKRSVEDSGLLFETKLKLAVREDSPQRIMNMLSDGDHKLELLRLKASLNDEVIVSALRHAGIKPADVEGMVDKLLKNIEFFQITSQVNDSIYTFIPLTWQELRDGELSFRRGRGESSDSYCCDINLDLEPAGKLSISVSLYEGRFFVTFHAEDQKFKEMIEESRGLLEQRFSDAGLDLQAVNVGRKEEISFGARKHQGLTIRV